MTTVTSDSERRKPYQETPSVLIISPDVEFVESTRSFLSHRQYVIHTADNGEQGIALAQELKPTIILFDLPLADIDGRAAMSSLASHGVIVVSESERVREVVTALRLGAADYLTKPVANTILEHALEQCIEQNRLRSENEQYRRALENTNKELKAYIRELEVDQQAGRHVQMKLLPNSPIRVGDYTFSHAVLPSLYLSGDFVDYVTVGDEHVSFVMADVSGHGASSAFVTVLLKNLIARMRSDFNKRSCEKILSPNQILQNVNNELLTTDTGKHVTMVVGVLNLTENSLIYSIAGHLPLPIILSDGVAEYLQGKGLPVGLFDEVDYEEHFLQLPDHFSLFLYSDGILELLNATIVQEKEQQLIKFMQLPRVGETAQDVIDRFRIAKIEELPDDVALLRLKR